MLTTLTVLALCACAQTPAEPADDASRKALVSRMYARYKAEFPDAPDMCPEKAVRLAREGRLVPVDVRTPAERAVSTLPGAVTEEAYLADPGRFAGKTVVVYCTIGYRSGRFAAAMAKKGLTIPNIAGGILGWLHAGGDLVDASGQPTTTVHVSGPTWNLAPRAYKAVW